MSKVIGLKENLNLRTFLKFFLRSYIARLHKLNNVPGNEEFYIKYNKIEDMLKIQTSCLRSQLISKKYRKEF